MTNTSVTHNFQNTLSISKKNKPIPNHSTSPLPKNKHPTENAVIPPKQIMQEKTFQILSTIREDEVSTHKMGKIHKKLASFVFCLYTLNILAPLELRTNDFKPFNSTVWNYFLLHQSSLIKSSFINNKAPTFYNFPQKLILQKIEESK